MSYIDELAAELRPGVAPELVPDGDTASLFRMYAVLALANGDRVKLEDVHDAWVAWMTELRPNHPSLRPLEELPPAIPHGNQPYLDAIRAVARKHHLGPQDR